jgi:hypothetical protein
MILIHSTHEAGFKVGGIGAVLDGLLSAPAYLAAVERTLLAGPMNANDPTEMERLFAPRNQLEARYCPARGIVDCPAELAGALSAVEQRWSARLLYGTRAFGPARHEVILVDAGDLPRERLRAFKYHAWQRLGLDSRRYEHEYEYDLYMAMAQPAFEAVQAVRDWRLEIGDWRLETLNLQSPISNPQSPIPNPESPILVCHEFMGLPLWMAAEIIQPGAWRSAYVAHEVPTVRALVENDRGHDTRFYNAMRLAQADGLGIDDVFGDQSGFYKHALVKAASRCDRILAVGDLVADELRFLGPEFHNRPIEVVYNAIHPQPHALADTESSKRKLQAYARELTGLAPTFVFSHVSRAVISKGLWRDVRVMEALDPLLAARGESAVLFMLATIIPQGRSAAEAQRMAREYGWPAAHREGWPDLHTLESPLWHAAAAFNAAARASRIVFINQFGFSRDRIGDSMPADLGFQDLRRGADLEFGQSVYEPFGIAQIEPLPSGALCVLSDVCGCIGFARAQLGSGSPYAGLDLESGAFDDDRRPFLNLVVADYTSLPAGQLAGWRDALNIGQAERDAVERTASQEAARRIIQRLPRSEPQKQLLLDDGAWMAERLSWDAVARDRLLPALRAL